MSARLSTMPAITKHRCTEGSWMVPIQPPFTSACQKGPLDQLQTRWPTPITQT
jgi:hypothetical protein